MKKISNGTFVFYLLFIYLLGLLVGNMIFDKDWETVIVKINKKEVGQFSTGITSNFKYSYQFSVLERDGFVGNIKNIYSNTELKENQVYGLELWEEECSNWFDYIFVPTIWSDYTFSIDRVYNDDKDLKGIDFNTTPTKVLIEKVEAEDKILGSKFHND